MGHRPRAFSLIELLVVMFIISIMIALLLPALKGSMEMARDAKCLSNLHGIGGGLEVYCADYGDAMPLMPVPRPLDIVKSQHLYGGLAGMFSLNQIGDGAHPGFGAAGDGQYYNGVQEPILRGYLSGLAALRCPRDRADRYYGMPYSPSGNLSYAQAVEIVPQPIGKESEAISYNISYMYFPRSGARGEESAIFADETNGPDINEFAWYGPRTGTSATTPNSTAAGAAWVGKYAPVDNHGKHGGNLLMGDGRGQLFKGDFGPGPVID